MRVLSLATKLYLCMFIVGMLLLGAMLTHDYLVKKQALIASAQQQARIISHTYLSELDELLRTQRLHERGKLEQRLIAFAHIEHIDLKLRAPYQKMFSLTPHASRFDSNEQTILDNLSTQQRIFYADGEPTLRFSAPLFMGTEQNGALCISCGAQALNLHAAGLYTLSLPMGHAFSALYQHMAWLAAKLMVIFGVAFAIFVWLLKRVLYQVALNIWQNHIRDIHAQNEHKQKHVSQFHASNALNMPHLSKHAMHQRKGVTSRI